MKKLMQPLLLLLFTIYTLDIYTFVALYADVVINQKHFQNISFSYIALYIFLLLLARFTSVRAYKIALTIISIPLTIAYLFILGYLVYYNSPLDYIAMLTILDTNPEETKEYIRTIFDFKAILLFLLLIIPYVLIFFIKPIKIRSFKILIPMLVVALVIVGFTFDKRWVAREISFFSLIQAYIKTNEDKETFFKILEERDKNAFIFENIKSLLNDNDNQTFVIIFGESQSRTHYSIYGYNRLTNPFLDSIKNELYLFDNVISPHVYTSSVMQKVLTFADNENESNAYEVGNIIDFFKSAGFKTYWFSNQYYLGYHDTAYSAIAYRADDARFLNQISGVFLETTNYDDKLLKDFKEVLDEKVKKKVIFLHLMGSHAPFELRYPQGFGAFNDYSLGLNDLLGGISKQKDIDTFDNSIMFTDYVLENIITDLKAENGDSYMLYFPDHGVDVYDFDPNKSITRNEANPTPEMYEIPFILWVSERYKKNYPEYINQFDNFTHRPYQTDKVIHSIIDLSRLDHPMVKRSYSIFSDNFTPSKRVISGKEYKK